MSLAVALLLVAAVTGAAAWIAYRAWVVYRRHFGIDGPVWMVRRDRP